MEIFNIELGTAKCDAEFGVPQIKFFTRICLTGVQLTVIEAGNLMSNLSCVGPR